MRPLSCLVACAVAVGLGCSSTAISTVLTPPPYDAEAIASALLQQYDRNGNDTLEATELNGCPALHSAFAAFDTDKDRRISRAELVSRIALYRNAGAGARVPVTARVSVGGRPVAGYTVTLTSEPAFGTVLAPASGTTDATGIAVFGAGDPAGGGVAAGLYRITVTNTTGSPVGGVTGREVFETGRRIGVIDLNY